MGATRVQGDRDISPPSPAASPPLPPLQALVLAAEKGAHVTGTPLFSLARPQRGPLRSAGLEASGPWRALCDMCDMCDCECVCMAYTSVGGALGTVAYWASSPSSLAPPSDAGSRGSERGCLLANASLACVSGGRLSPCGPAFGLSPSRRLVKWQPFSYLDSRAVS